MCTLSYTACEHALLRSRQAHSPVHPFHIQKKTDLKPFWHLSLQLQGASFTQAQNCPISKEKPTNPFGVSVLVIYVFAPEGEEYDFFLFCCTFVSSVQLFLLYCDFQDDRGKKARDG